MLHVYGSPLSMPSIKVQFCVNAMELEYEYHEVNLREGEHKGEAYLAINPYGRVPAIDDDGFRLAESNAIMRYLGRKSNSPLYPESIKEQAIVNQWLDFVTAHLANGYAKVVFNTLFAPMMGQEPDTRSMEEGRVWVDNCLAIIDKRLAESAYLASDDLSIADLGFLSATDPSELVNIDLAGFPNVARLRNDLRSRSLYTNVHSHFGEGILD